MNSADATLSTARSPGQSAGAAARLFAAVAVAALLGLTLPKFIAAGMEPQSAARAGHTIAASIALMLLGLGWLLAQLPASPARPAGWPHIKAWLKSAAVHAAAMLGLGLSGGHGEDAHTFVALWSIYAASAALLCGLNALLCAWLFPRFTLARQMTLLLLLLGATAMLWSREPLFALKRQPQTSRTAERLAESVLKISPPVAVVSTWYQEGAQARNPQRLEDKRYNVLVGPLSYHVWWGTDSPLPYPAIWPKLKRVDLDRRFEPGVVLLLALWGVPLLLLGDALLHYRKS